MADHRNAAVTLFVAGAAFVMAGCDTPRKKPAGCRLAAFVDLSASVTAAQRNAWLQQATTVVEGLDNGCGISIYALHDQTASAAPLYAGEMLERAEDPGHAELIRYNHSVAEVQENAGRAFALAFTQPGRALVTDIFSAIDRVRSDVKGRRTTVVFFSDMLNSTPILNLEAPPALDAAAIPDRIQAIAEKHNWNSRTLHGAEVYCILNSLDSGARQPVTDRRTQQHFYQALFRALGAKLMLYDTHLSPGATDLCKGDSNDVSL